MQYLIDLYSLFIKLFCCQKLSFFIKLFLEIVVYMFVYMANTPGEWVFYPPKSEI